MAGIIKRNNYWWACWKLGRKTIRRSTGVPVKQAGKTARALEQAARIAVDGMEQAAKGLRPADKVLDSVRGAWDWQAWKVTFQAYANTWRLSRSWQESSRRETGGRSFKVFLEFLGADADKRLDKINHTRCRDFVRWALGQVSRKTVQQYYTYVSGAFKRAVEVDDLLNKNPMAGVSVATEAASVIPEKGEDKQKREPFTCEEVIYLIPFGNFVSK